jgi:hypothetical protein
MPVALNLALVVILALALLAALVLVVLVATADRWLVALLTGLDRILTRMGIGTWSARLLTRGEDWARARREARSRRKVGDGGPAPPK